MDVAPERLTELLASTRETCIRLAKEVQTDEISRPGAPDFLNLLETYCNEAGVGLDMVRHEIADLKRDLGRPPRLLEVGAGVGLLSGVLSQAGLDVLGVEPSASEFAFMRTLGDIVTQAFTEHESAFESPVIASGVEDLDPTEHGAFDLIFSVHVLEHLADLEGAISTMSALLAPGGRMIHLCPNYAFPYEPHLAIPLLPLAPSRTRHLFPRTVARQKDVWNSLNFITAGRVRRLCRENGRTPSFAPAVMGRFLRRLESDPHFSRRHQGFALSVYSVLKRFGMLRIIDLAPARMASPMIVRIK